MDKKLKKKIGDNFWEYDGPIHFAAKKELIDEKTFYAFRNLSNAYLIEPNELNAYTAVAFDSIIIEKNVLENLTKEG